MLEIFTQSFFINSFIAIMLISMVTGALGSFMIWQRLSYLGDSLSHSLLLGTALALIFKISLSISMIFMAIIFAILLSLNFNKLYSLDAVLNILTNVVLSLGLILMSFLPLSSTSIMNSLFGDILTLDRTHLIFICLVSVSVALALIFRWNYWLINAIDREIALVEKINTSMIRLEFSITLALFIAITAQFMGILLISGFLLIPAASARLISKTPTQMVILATFFAVTSGISGLILSACFDLLTGPTIILASSVYWILSYLIKNKLQF